MLWFPGNPKNLLGPFLELTLQGKNNLITNKNNLTRLFVCLLWRIFFESLFNNNLKTSEYLLRRRKESQNILREIIGAAQCSAFGPGEVRPDKSALKARTQHERQGVHCLSGPILRYYRCDTPHHAMLVQGGSHSPKMVRSPPPSTEFHKHISACVIPHFATYRGIISVRYPTRTSKKELCKTTSIARCEKCRCWADEACISISCEHICLGSSGSWPHEHIGIPRALGAALGSMLQGERAPSSLA